MKPGRGRGVKKNNKTTRVEFIARDRQCQSNQCVESLTAQVFEDALTPCSSSLHHSTLLRDGYMGTEQ